MGVVVAQSGCGRGSAGGVELSHGGVPRGHTRVAHDGELREQVETSEVGDLQCRHVRRRAQDTMTSFTPSTFDPPPDGHAHFRFGKTTPATPWFALTSLRSASSFSARDKIEREEGSSVEALDGGRGRRIIRLTDTAKTLSTHMGIR